MNEMAIPPEVTGFSFSGENLKEILGNELGESRESIEFEDGSIVINLSKSRIKEMIEKRYNREVKSINVEDGMINVNLENV